MNFRIPNVFMAVLLVVNMSVPKIVSGKEKVSIEFIEKWLSTTDEQGKCYLSDKVIVDRLNEYGIDFYPDEKAIDRLKQAGASNEVIGAICTAEHPPGEIGYEPKSLAGGILRSLVPIYPLGHSYIGQFWRKGCVFGALEVLALGVACYTGWKSNENYDHYKQNATHKHKLREARNWRKATCVFGVASVGIYLCSIYDVYNSIQSSKRDRAEHIAKKRLSPGISVSTGRDGMVFSHLVWRF